MTRLLTRHILLLTGSTALAEMVSFRGRLIDPVALWSNYVTFPEGWQPDPNDEFSPLVVCPNPDHQTSKRHFQVNLKRPLCHCFACGFAGTWEDAIAKIEGVTHRQARKTIARHSRVGHIPIKRKRAAAKVVSSVAVEYERYLPQAAMDYLKIRGISEKAIARWELGWDSDDLRVVIPAKDQRGRTQFLIRRAVKPNVEPRYLYPKDSARNRLLFGACLIDPGMVKLRGIALVEGSIDCIVFDQHGILPVVAILGSKLSEIQARILVNLRPARIYTMFDADAAGVGATISVAKQVSGIPLYVCRYPKGKTDPAMLLAREEAQRVIDRAISFREFRQRAGLANPRHTNRRKVFNG